MSECGDRGESLRIDRLLWMLRLAKSRSAAQEIVGSGHIRRNGIRVTRMSQPVCAGDVLTVPLGRAIRVIELASLPTRRGPALEAQSHYRELGSGGHIVETGTPALDDPDMRP